MSIVLVTYAGLCTFMSSAHTNNIFMASAYLYFICMHACKYKCMYVCMYICNTFAPHIKGSDCGT